MSRGGQNLFYGRAGMPPALVGDKKILTGDLFHFAPLLRLQIRGWWLLVNYDSHGIESTRTKTSDAQGLATFAVALHVKIRKISHRPDPPDYIYTPPTLKVSATAFNRQEIGLLDTP